MISPEKRQSIVSLHRSGCTIRHISRLLKVSRNTVRRVINGREVKEKAGKHEPIEAIVQELFGPCKQNVVRIQQVLHEQYGRQVPYSSLTRLVRELELRERKKTKRAGTYAFAPGEEMQHDTSPHPLILDGKKITAQCASLTLGYCRKIFVQYYPRFTRFEARVFLTEAFKYMEGACRRCVIDNTSVIIAHGSGSDATMAPEMEAFGRIFNTAFIAHRIKDHDRKAKVERNFRYIENNFLAGRTFTGWNDLNRRAIKWCDTVANPKPKRSLGRMSPDAVYVMEKPHLTALPPHIPPVYKAAVRVVDMSGFVTVDTNRYSVPERFCGQKVEVLKSFDRIEVYRNHRRIADHPRLIDKRDGKITAKGHHPPIHRLKGKKLCSEEQQALMGCCPSLDQYVIGLKKRTRGIGRRKLKTLLELKRTYPADAFTKAVEQALHYGLYDLARLENLILTFVAGDFFDLAPEE
ncbi:MAG: IS21/IS408/IS1162 family transposase [Brevefilum sp.]